MPMPHMATIKDTDFILDGGSAQDIEVFSVCYAMVDL